MVAALAALTACGGGSSPRPVWVGAPPEIGPPIVPDHAPASYRIVYRVDAGRPVGATVTTETLLVRRPWASVLETRDGPPPGGPVTDTITSDFGKLRLKPSTGATQVIVLTADIAASDLRLDADPTAIVKAGLGRWAERRRVAGRSCQVFVTSAPPQGQSLGALTPTGDQVESCIDAEGLVLAQVHLFNGKLLLRRTAVDVQDAPAVDAAMFSVAESSTIPLSQGGGSIVKVDPSTLPPGPSWFLDNPPDGFAYQGHYAVAESDTPDQTGQTNPNRRGGFTDVWTRGVDVLLLDQGGTLYGGTAFGPAAGATHVDLGPLGTADAIAGPRLSTVRVTMKDGRYLRLAGTLPLAALITIARGLVSRDNAASAT